MDREGELTEDEIRRLFLTDEEWARTHPTYKALKPRRNFNEFRVTDETEAEYAARIGATHGFPAEVLEQWLYGLYFDANAVNNYGWIDYSTIEFQRQRWPTERLQGLRVIEDYQSYVDERSATFNSVDEFVCIQADLEHWRTHGTWRVPPVAINTNGLGPVPGYSDVVGQFQLIEGHSRSGYLRALSRIGRSQPVVLAATHDVFVLTANV